MNPVLQLQFAKDWVWCYLFWQPILLSKFVKYSSFCTSFFVTATSQILINGYNTSLHFRRYRRTVHH